MSFFELHSVGQVRGGGHYKPCLRDATRNGIMGINA
eukprot:CAMPEP_0171320636 /NCGR_PEP_ID=MMETSP0816-20121228/105875_1 /TAXON_ID=420281 /ORGANISM="Proboscia inermis, Strain CCAP1064/1" /LENGTH=35 /DNA_ID= /DNA_START= /DNA_END= /DNA_ORIENTATION=